jgi:hypothetical protein
MRILKFGTMCMGVSGQLHILATLSLGNNPRWPLDKRSGLRTGLDAVEKKTSLARLGNQISILWSFIP